MASEKVKRLQQAEAASVEQAEQLRKLKEEVGPAGHALFISLRESNSGYGGLKIGSFRRRQRVLQWMKGQPKSSFGCSSSSKRKGRSAVAPGVLKDMSYYGNQLDAGHMFI